MNVLSLVVVALLNAIFFLNVLANESNNTEESETESYVTDMLTCSNNDCNSEITTDDTTKATNIVQNDKTSAPNKKLPEKEQKKTETDEKKVQKDKTQKINPAELPVIPKPKQQTSKPKTTKPTAKVEKSIQSQNKSDNNYVTKKDNSKTEVKYLLTATSCNCDTTSGICEINCCCDEDCTKDNKMVFSQCEDEANYISRSDYCFSPNVIFRNNTPYRTFNLRPGLLCIARNNLPDKIKYYNHKVVKTEGEITKILKKRNTFKWKLKSNEFKSELDEDKPYIFGSPIWIFRNNSEEASLNKLTIKEEGITSMCGSQYIVGYLEDMSTSCLIKTPKNKIECEGASHVSAANFKNLFALISPKLINSSTDLQELYLDETLIKIQIIICLNNTCKEESNAQMPNFNGQNKICNNIVSKIKYQIKHNGTEGITEMNCFIYLENIPINRSTFRQEYQVEFEWINKKHDNFIRSGKPGYQSGKPLIVGNKTEKTVNDIKSEIFVIPQDSNSWLTLSTSSKDGICSDERKDIMFNENIISECTVVIRKEQMNAAENCSEINEKIERYLHNGAFKSDNLWISSWGDPRLEDSSSWVPLVIISKHSEPSCHHLTTAIAYQFLYSLSGPLGSPHAKLIGAVLETKTSSFFCESPQCLVKLTTTVSFTSVTPVPRLTYPKHPALRLHLPKDFFYPFSSSSSTSFLKHNYCIISILYTLMILFI